MIENSVDRKMKNIHTEAKQMMDQTKSLTADDMEVNNFIELEKKKFKKTDDLQDLLDRY